MRLPIPPYPHKLDTIFYYLIYSQMILFLLRIKKILLFVSKCQQFCKSQCLLSAKANLNAYHELRLEWAVMESNHPSPKTADLQSAPLPLRYNHPYKYQRLDSNQRCCGMNAVPLPLGYSGIMELTAPSF